MKTTEKIEALKKAQTIEDLKSLEIGKIDYEISHRGGSLGFYGSDIAGYLEIDADLLPRKFGAYCNYLGGGLRGCICTSDFSTKIKNEEVIELLMEIGEA